ncbi:hypothetical protein ABBQ38_013822 [Trebouxia sp. C0009 RCD-2024]
MVDREEQYVLRVQDKAVAARIRKQLNQEHSKAKLDVRLDASHSDGRTGQFSFGSEVLPVTLLDLPCVVESYKTYDDSHLVKMCDVGQMLHVQTEGTSQPEHFESINGVTPAMRNARKRHFNNAHVDHQEVQAVEDDLLQLASGRAPQNMIIEDIEEEYKIDEHGNGSWQPVEKKAAPKVLLNVKGEPGTKPKRKKPVKKAPPDVEQL